MLPSGRVCRFVCGMAALQRVTFQERLAEMFKRLLFATVAFCSMNGLHAETWYLKNIGTSAYLFDTHASWTNSAGQTATAFSADDTYIMKNPARINSAACDGFVGVLQLYSTFKVYNSFSLPKIVAHNATFELQGKDDMIVNFNVPIDMVPTTKPTTFRWCYSNQTIVLPQKITGEPGAQIVTDVRNAGSGHMNEVLELAGDCSEFFGSIDVKIGRKVDTYRARYPNFWSKLRLSAENFNSPMSITVQEDCALETSGAVVKNVNLANNALVAIKLVPNGTGLVVTNSFILNGNAFLETFADESAWAEVDRSVTNYCPLITVPLSQNVDWSKFTLNSTMTFGQTEPHYYSVTNAVDGTETFTLVMPPETIVRLTETDYRDKGRVNLTVDEMSSAFDKPASWSDGELPHGDAHYVVECLDGLETTWVRTRVAMSSSSTLNVKSLTLGKSCYLVTWFKKLTMPVLRMMDGSYLWTGQPDSTYRTRIIDAEIEIPYGTVHIGPYAGSIFVFDRPIRGYGTMLIEGVTDTGSPSGRTVLAADNSEFFGRIHVKQRLSSRDSQTLVVSKASNLGADLPVFDPRALTIDDRGHLLLTNSIVLEASSNRGMHLCNGGVVNVTNKDDVLTLNWPLMISGTVQKRGNGTLALGGAISASKLYTLEIENGSVQPLKSDLCSHTNLMFSFNSGGRLLIDLETDLGGIGFKNTTRTPFILKEGVPSLPISVRGDKETALSNDGEHALLTVSAAAADDVAAILPEQPPKPFPSLVASWTRTANTKQKTVTFGVKYRYLALRITVR